MINIMPNHVTRIAAVNIINNFDILLNENISVNVKMIPRLLFVGLFTVFVIWTNIHNDML